MRDISRRSGDAGNVWMALGLGALAGAAGLVYYQQATRNKVGYRPPDAAPPRTARTRRVGRYAVAGRTVTIAKPRDELYAFWRDFQNLPRFMENVRGVELSGDVTWWTIAGPLGRDVSVETRIVEDIEGLRALDGGPLANAPEVEGITPLLVNLAQRNDMHTLGVKFQ